MTFKWLSGLPPASRYRQRTRGQSRAQAACGAGTAGTTDARGYHMTDVHDAQWKSEHTGHVIS